jgi:hypothetical protein
MNSTLATELPDKAATRSLLETWGKNERMRHVPRIEWIAEKLDRDLRRRIQILSAASPMNDSIDAELKSVGRSIDRVADAAKYSRAATQPPAELPARLDFAITHAVSCLNSLDPNLFGRRYPFQTFERSKAESVYSALLVVIDRVHRATEIVRAVDRSVDEKLLEAVA